MCPLYHASPLPAANSPLSPYTTLFRSVSPEGIHSGKDTLPWEDFADAEAKQGQLLVRAAGRSWPCFASASAKSSDRKSTRLNSSHRCISYAVFCLKKKKNTLNE